MVLDGELVECALIYPQAKGTAFLVGKQDWGSSWRLGMTDESFLEIVVQVLMQGY